MSAVLSPCGLYRYTLERQIAPTGYTVLFVGINPSTADADLDDATVRKWRGFAQRWGCSRFLVGNVFAYRSTDVRGLHDDPRALDSIENRRYLNLMAHNADFIVPCWGSRDKIPREWHHHIDNALARLARVGKPLMHMGLTASGDPKHPLMLGYDTKLVPFTPAAPRL